MSEFVSSGELSLAQIKDQLRERVVCHRSGAVPLMEEALSSEMVMGDLDLLQDRVGSEGGWNVLGCLDLLRVGRTWSSSV